MIFFKWSDLIWQNFSLGFEHGVALGHSSSNTHMFIFCKWLLSHYRIRAKWLWQRHLVLHRKCLPALRPRDRDSKFGKCHRPNYQPCPGVIHMLFPLLWLLKLHSKLLFLPVTQKTKIKVSTEEITAFLFQRPLICLNFREIQRKASLLGTCLGPLSPNASTPTWLCYSTGQEKKKLGNTSTLRKGRFYILQKV